MHIDVRSWLRSQGQRANDVRGCRQPVKKATNFSGWHVMPCRIACKRSLMPGSGTPTYLYAGHGNWSYPDAIEPSLAIGFRKPFACGYFCVYVSHFYHRVLPRRSHIIVAAPKPNSASDDGSGMRTAMLSGGLCSMWW